MYRTLPVSSSPLQFRNQSKPIPNPKSPNHNLHFAPIPSTVKLRASHSPNPVTVIAMPNRLACGDDGHSVFNDLQYRVDRPDKNSASKLMRRCSINGKGKLDEDEDLQRSHIPGLGSTRPALLQEVVKARPNGPKLLWNGCHLRWPNTKLGTRGRFLYTSESVTEGHPDKLCDQISDKVVDACLEQDLDSKVACESWTKNNEVGVVGKITSRANVDYKKLVHDTCRDIGYVSNVVGLDADRCEVLLDIEQQSPCIRQGVYGHLTMCPEDIGAGHVLVFGYATNETAELMPLGQVVTNKAAARMDRFRKEGTYPWLGPAGKARVTCEYSDEKGAMVPIRILDVVIITQRDETVTKDKIAADHFMERVIKPVIPTEYLDVGEKTNFKLNFSREFVPGGPCGYAGHTGRQIMADNYGGLVPLVGGDFSGKDPTKVERCGAYLARQAAKSIVAYGLAERCVVHVLYAIVEPEPEPLSVTVDTYETGKIPDKKISEIVKENFDFRPEMIAINLDLKRGGNGRFSKTAVYGHFGRDDPDFPWEVVKRLTLPHHML